MHQRARSLWTVTAICAFADSRVAIYGRRGGYRHVNSIGVLVMNSVQNVISRGSSPIARIIAALLSGAIFGAGLVISGMSNPHKVHNFLAIGPNWDPSLLVVMGAATITAFLGYRLIWRRRKPLYDEQFHIPDRRDIDRPLVIGALLFGLGWGIAGYCPGPALTALLIVPSEGIWFVGAMLAGMVAQRRVSSPSGRA